MDAFLDWLMDGFTTVCTWYFHLIVWYVKTGAWLMTLPDAWIDHHAIHNDGWVLVQLAWWAISGTLYALFAVGTFFAIFLPMPYWIWIAIKGTVIWLPRDITWLQACEYAFLGEDQTWEEWFENTGVAIIFLLLLSAFLHRGSGTQVDTSNR